MTNIKCLDILTKAAQQLTDNFKAQAKIRPGQNYKFSDLRIGDMFNTVTSRWVKVSEKEAMVVMSSMLELGYKINIPDTISIIVLYSSLLHQDLS